MYYDEQFINTFNENYPFERYILKEPKRINYLFDDVKLTEIFIPSTEIKPITDDNGNLITFTEIPYDEIYVKLIGPSGEFRMAYFDFAEHIREEIRVSVVLDMGQYEWECLYVDHEDDDEEELREFLKMQHTLITKKYGECKLKENVTITSTIDIVNQL